MKKYYENSIGDIPSVIGKLSYLKDLGIDFIWFTPLYDSPLKELGYDVSNFKTLRE